MLLNNLGNELAGVAGVELSASRNEVAALYASAQKHHVTMNYVMVAVLVFCLVGGGWFVGRTLGQYQRQLDAADARYTSLKADIKEAAAAQAQHDKERADNTAKQDVIVKVIHDRDTAVDKHVAEVTATDRTDVQVASDVTKAYGEPAFLNWNILSHPGFFTFRRDQVQAFTASKINADRYQADVAGAQSALDLEKKTSTSLRVDLKAADDNLTKSKQSIEDFKKLAKKNKYLNAARKVGEIGAIIGIEYVLHKR